MYPFTVHIDGSQIPESFQEKFEKKYNTRIDGIVKGNHVERGSDSITIFATDGREFYPRKNSEFWNRLFNK